MSTIWVPPEKGKLFGKSVIEAIKKFPDDESVVKIVIQAVTAEREGIKVIQFDRINTMYDLVQEYYQKYEANKKVGLLSLKVLHDYTITLTPRTASGITKVSEQCRVLNVVTYLFKPHENFFINFSSKQENTIYKSLKKQPENSAEK